MDKRTLVVLVTAPKRAVLNLTNFQCLFQNCMMFHSVCLVLVFLFSPIKMFLGFVFEVYQSAKECDIFENIGGRFARFMSWE